MTDIKGFRVFWLDYIARFVNNLKSQPSIFDNQGSNEN